MSENTRNKFLVEQWKSEIIDHANPDDYGGYKYYKRNNGPYELDRPIRIVLDKEGDEIGANTINSDTGELIKKASLISEVLDSPFIEDSTEEEFYKLCYALIQKKRQEMPKLQKG